MNALFTRNRLIDDAQHRPAILQQRNQRAEDRTARQEGGCSVDRIDQPLAARGALACAVFFAHYAVLGNFSCQYPANRLFHLAICD